MIDKLKMLGCLFILLILPIIGNLIMICLFPLFSVLVLFTAENKSIELIETYRNSIATFKSKYI